jgi:hypothetical protein
MLVFGENSVRSGGIPRWRYDQNRGAFRKIARRRRAKLVEARMNNADRFLNGGSTHTDFVIAADQSNDPSTPANDVMRAAV